MNIGLVPTSAKPYHAGHDGLVRIAATENDIVKLFISISDRSRPGEIRISGSTMQVIWKDFIEPTLPSNVILDYGGTPVSKVYAELEKAEVNQSIDTYVIYSDETDILKFTDKSLVKSAPTLFRNGQIKLRGIKRSETIDISGTKMRKLIKDNDDKGFISMLPPSIQSHGKEIFDMLRDKITSESLLRRYIKTILENKN